jgi:alpha-tubulin suppressor-like RCC1 family protein
VLVINHSLATKTDGTLWSWGSNGSGQLGQNNQIPGSSPVQIPGTHGVQ